ncbi:MAG: hypothetical protein NZ585_12605 [Chloracidobacterium sp.]|nr:hypothetical protein [Chloracidobacterium sp.]
MSSYRLVGRRNVIPDRQGADGAALSAVLAVIARHRHMPAPCLTGKQPNRRETLHSRSQAAGWMFFRLLAMVG